MTDSDSFAHSPEQWGPIQCMLWYQFAEKHEGTLYGGEPIDPDDVDGWSPRSIATSAKELEEWLDGKWVGTDLEDLYNTSLRAVPRAHMELLAFDHDKWCDCGDQSPHDHASEFYVV